MSTFGALWADIAEVGRDPHTGGYRRFVLGEADQTLREWFTGCASTPPLYFWSFIRAADRPSFMPFSISRVSQHTISREGRHGNWNR